MDSGTDETIRPPDDGRVDVGDTADTVDTKDMRAAAALTHARLGDLTFGWRAMLGVAWLSVFLAYAAIWQASVQIGIATWWIGPRADPMPSVVRMIPFALALSLVLFAIYNVRKLIHLSIAASLVAAAIAVPDVSRSVGLAVSELVVAGLVLLVSIAALSGRYRLAPAGSTANQWPPPPGA